MPKFNYVAMDSRGKETKGSLEVASQNEAIGRLISYAMRVGAKVDPLIKQLKGISCHRPAWGEDATSR